MTLAFTYQGFPGAEALQFNSLPYFVYPQQPAVLNVGSSYLELRPPSNLNNCSMSVEPTGPSPQEEGNCMSDSGADKKLRSKGTQKKSRSPKIELEDRRDPDQKKNKVWKNSLLSFTCNKILKFILDPSRSQPILQTILRQNNLDSQEDIDEFYAYVAKAIDKIINRISIHKIRDLWLGPTNAPSTGHPRPEGALLKLYHHIIRVLSKYYLERVSVSFVLLAKKSKKAHWFQHLRMRRWLIKNLHNP